ncbi:MAG: L,D-transpeptidase family protein [Patescibacteria group bacterium]
MEEKSTKNAAKLLAVFLFLFFFLSLILVNTAYATPSRSPEVKTWNYEEVISPDKSFFAFDQGFQGGVSVAIGDLGGDGKNEIVTGAGNGGGPQVRFFSKRGTFINQFFAYDEGFHGGINVAVGDLEGDGKEEIITAPKKGGGPQIRTFDGWGNPIFTNGFMAFDENFKGGVNITAGDVDGDGQEEIIAGAGQGGSPHVRVFNKQGEYTGLDFIPFSENDKGGVTVAAGNFDGDKNDEIVMAIQSVGETWVKVYKTNADKTILGEFRAFPVEVRGGLNIAAGDVDGDGRDEVIVAIASIGGPQVKFFESYGAEIHPGFMAYEENFRGGVNLAAGNLDADDEVEIITGPSKTAPSGNLDYAKYYEVNLSEQKAYAYEYGYKVKEMLISGGLPGTPSPTGTFSVFRKIYSHLYAGPGFYLPNTLYNLNFYGPYYIHGAYWHNNFGHPMSHGCINLSYPDAEWMFNWAEVGTPVIVHY